MVRGTYALQAPVDLAAVGDFHDKDHEPTVVDLVGHPVVADPEPVEAIGSGKLLDVSVLTVRVVAEPRQAGEDM
jgi:hypothetical protein